MIGVAGWHKFLAAGASVSSFGPEPDLRLRFA
jgi:hypothetical protein